MVMFFSNSSLSLFLMLFIALRSIVTCFSSVGVGGLIVRFRCSSIGVAGVGERVVDDGRAARAAAALWVGRATARFGAIILWLPALKSPEHVVLSVENVFVCSVCLSEHGIALTEGPPARACVVLANIFAPVEGVDVEPVFRELADALVTVRFAGALEAVFVFFADVVERIDGRSESRVAHWSVSEHEAVAAVGPVLSLVEGGVEEFHEVLELPIAARPLLFQCVGFPGRAGKDGFG